MDMSQPNSGYMTTARPGGFEPETCPPEPPACAKPDDINCGCACAAGMSAALELLCDARFTQMTGSGSCVFGCYDTESSAREAYERIKKRAYFSCLTHSR